MRSLAAACVSIILFSPLSIAHVLPDKSHEISHSSHETSEHSSKTAISIEISLIDQHSSHQDNKCYRKENQCSHEDKKKCYQVEKECSHEDKNCYRVENQCSHEDKKKCYQVEKECSIEALKCNKKEDLCYEKLPSDYEFKCRKKHFKKSKILAAARAACPLITANPQKNVFPSLHTAFTFEREGPLVEWPIKRNGKFWNKWSKSRYRIVMTAKHNKCQIVGAVYRRKNKSYEKCTFVPK